MPLAFMITTLNRLIAPESSNWVRSLAP